MNFATYEISNVLGNLLKLNAISEAELARKIRLPRATINRLVSGRTPDPRASTLNAIAEYFNISVDQLLGKKPLIQNMNGSLITDSTRSIPLLKWEEAMDWETHLISTQSPTNQSWVSIDQSAESGKFSLKVQGEAMWPQFQENSILIIDPEKEPNNRDFVICHIEDNNELIFRQLLVDGKTRFLKPINNLFSSVLLKERDKIIGVVIQTRNNYS